MTLDPAAHGDALANCEVGKPEWFLVKATPSTIGKTYDFAVNEVRYTAPPAEEAEPEYEEPAQPEAMKSKPAKKGASIPAAVSAVAGKAK